VGMTDFDLSDFPRGIAAERIRDLTARMEVMERAVAELRATQANFFTNVFTPSTPESQGATAYSSTTDPRQEPTTGNSAQEG
jgi:hypothetical protein